MGGQMKARPFSPRLPYGRSAAYSTCSAGAPAHLVEWRRGVTHCPQIARGLPAPRGPRRGASVALIGSACRRVRCRRGSFRLSESQHGDGGLGQGLLDKVGRSHGQVVGVSLICGST